MNSSPRPGERTLSEKAIFRLENVTKIFRGASEVVALDKVNLTINEGEIYGIIGMSGAGKSTLVRTLNRLEDVTDGTVYFQEEALGSLSKNRLREVRRDIGMIFQGFNLLNQKTVSQNIGIALKIAGIEKKERQPIIDKMLDIVGLSDKASSYPSQLSGGQKQRVAIARALSTNPKVILCDEATSALDPKMTGEILNLLKKVNKELGVTIIIITHEMSVIEAICDKVAVVNNGHIEEEGKVTEIFANPKSDITRRMVYPDNIRFNTAGFSNRRCVRLVFDGTASEEPIIADLASSHDIKVSILSANTKSVGSVGFGQMIVALPKEEDKADKAIDYFKAKNVFGEEITEELKKELTSKERSA